ncbi:MAG: hypothetical protein K0Q50_104 [Vampirovibrio sp.]|jgi:hypothetical protein|nr:hypothetical protein [Vampirovibrio sp.]
MWNFKGVLCNFKTVQVKKSLEAVFISSYLLCFSGGGDSWPLIGIELKRIMSTHSVKTGFSVFSHLALLQAPRILGLCDREPASRTFGCCDRNYWHYRLLDLPNARLQEVCWYLALLYKYPFKGENGRFYQNPRLVTWIQGMLDFWLKHRNGDGSVNEVYPFERSFCATSFSTLSVTESLLLLDGKLTADMGALTKTGKWLAANNNPTVFNQEAASLVALHNLATLTGDKKFLCAAAKRKDLILQAQHPTGYFPEYGGMDIGYLTISLGLLALYVEKTNDGDIMAACQRAASFLEPRIGEDGRYDASQTSRRTQYLYPSGLAAFAPQILNRLQNGLEQDVVINPQWMDDRYCIALATDYLLTVQMLEQTTTC